MQAVYSWVVDAMPVDLLQISVMLGAATFAGFVATFFSLQEPLLYAASIIWGFGNAIISVGISTIVSHNSGVQKNL